MIKWTIGGVTAVAAFAFLMAGSAFRRSPEPPPPAPDRAGLDALASRERELRAAVEKLARENAARQAAIPVPAPPAPPAAPPTLKEFLAAVDWERLARTTLRDELGIRVTEAAQEAAWKELRRINKELDRRFGLHDVGASLLLPSLLLARNRLTGNDPLAEAAIRELSEPLEKAIEEAAARPSAADNELRLRGLEIEEDYLRRLRQRVPALPLPDIFNYMDKEAWGPKRDSPNPDSEAVSYWKRELELQDGEAALLTPACSDYASKLSASNAARQWSDCLRHRVELQKFLIERFGSDPARAEIIRKDQGLTIWLDVVVTRYDPASWK